MDIIKNKIREKSFTIKLPAMHGQRVAELLSEHYEVEVSVKREGSRCEPVEVELTAYEIAQLPKFGKE